MDFSLQPNTESYMSDLAKKLRADNKLDEDVRDAMVFLVKLNLGKDRALKDIRRENNRLKESLGKLKRQIKEQNKR